MRDDMRPTLAGTRAPVDTYLRVIGWRRARRRDRSRDVGMAGAGRPRPDGGSGARRGAARAVRLPRRRRRAHLDRHGRRATPWARGPGALLDSVARHG